MDTNKKDKNEKKKDLCEIKISQGPLVREIFEHWKIVMDKPKSKLDAKRRRAVEARLREGHSVADLKKAIEGCAKSKFHMGENDQSKLYNDLELICRNSVKVEAFMANLSAKGVPRKRKDEFYRPMPSTRSKDGVVANNGLRNVLDILNDKKITEGE